MKIKNVLSKELWENIDETVERYVKVKSSIRPFIKIEKCDRLAFVNGIKNEEIDNRVVGVYDISSSVKVKFSFSINRYEIDLLDDGIEKFDFTPVENAISELIKFEEDVFYNGYKKANIKGLLKSLETPIVETKGDPQSIIDSILKSAIILRENGIEGPYQIVMGKDILEKTSALVSGKTLASIIEEELEEEILVSDAFKGAILIPKNSENIVFNELMPISTEVAEIDDDEIEFFLSENFNMEIFDDKTAVYIKLV